jgi:hypothetical protein
VLAHHPGDQGDAELEEDMGDTVYQDGLCRGITEDDLLDTLGGGIPQIEGLDVVPDHPPEVGDFFQEDINGFGGLLQGQLSVGILAFGPFACRGKIYWLR